MGYQIDFGTLLVFAPLFLAGLEVTASLSVLTVIFSFVLALPGAAARVSGVRWLRLGSGLYVHIIRNMPLLVLLYIVYFGLASLGLRLSSYVSGLIALVLNSTAYTIEIYRSGIVGVPPGQQVAAAALNLSTVQTWRYIVLPQALRVAYHALGNQVIGIVLGTSLVFVVAEQDLTFAAFTVGAQTFRYFEAFIVASLIYLGIVQALNGSWSLLGRRLLPKGRV